MKGGLSIDGDCSRADRVFPPPCRFGSSPRLAVPWVVVGLFVSSRWGLRASTSFCVIFGFKSDVRN